MKITQIASCTIAALLAHGALTGCADPVDEDEGDDPVAEEPIVEGSVPAGTCLRVDASKVHSTINVRSSPDVPEPDEEDNVRAKLPPTGPRSFFSVLSFQSVGGADSGENGSWYRARFRLANGNIGDGWVKGVNLLKVKKAQGGGEPIQCKKLRVAPNVEVSIKTADIHPPVCLRVIEGDLQAQGLVVRSEPEIPAAGKPDNRAGALGARGLARVRDIKIGTTRDWYLVDILDAGTGLSKQGWVSGRGNFVGAANQCSAIPFT